VIPDEVLNASLETEIGEPANGDVRDERVDPRSRSSLRSDLVGDDRSNRCLDATKTSLIRSKTFGTPLLWGRPKKGTLKSVHENLNDFFRTGRNTRLMFR